MAGRNVELGTVGFNLFANDDSLDASLAKLRTFGDAVVKASHANDEAGQKTYQSMVRVERIMSSVFDKVSALTDKMKQVGVDDAQVRKLTQDYGALLDAAVKASIALDPHEGVRAQVGLSAAVQQATRSLKEEADAIALTEAKQAALVAAWERMANLQSRFRVAGAGEANLAQFQGAYNNLARAVETDVKSVNDLRAAQRAYNQELGESTRQLREQLATQNEQERLITRLLSAQRNVAYLNARVLRSGLPSSTIDQNNAALQSFAGALQGGNQEQIAAAQRKLNDALLATRVAMAGAEKPASALSLIMHDLSKASVLALGPLSGVGARIAIMTSLLDSNTVSMALFVGGAVAMTAGLYKISEAAIKAASDQQKFDALLLSSTGSATLVADEFKYISDVANRLGSNVRGLVQPYTEFTAAARMAGFTLEDERKIFEAVMTTGSALRWDHEQTGRAFLAITQMISKTTVMSEEYKKQLGQLIPNIFGLGAAAENTSTRGLMKMMQSSQLLANEHLPKLAQKLMEAFSPAAAAGAKTLTADIERMHNQSFELAKSFDQATQMSKLFQSGIQTITSVMGFLQNNIGNVVAGFGALLGAAAGYGVARLLMSLPSLIVAVGGALSTLIGFINGTTTAVVALQSTTIIGFLVTLTTTVIGAGLAFKFLKDKQAELADIKTNEWATQMDQWIQTQEKLGQTQYQTWSRNKQQTNDRLIALQSEIAKEQELLRIYREKLTAGIAGNYKSIGLKVPDERITSTVDKDPDVLRMQAKISKLQEQWVTAAALYERLTKMTVAPDPKNEPPENKAWEAWVKRVDKAIIATQGAKREFQAFQKTGESGLEIEKALMRAEELLRDMPKQAGNIGEVAAALQKAGFSGKTLVDQLTAMFLAEERAKQGIVNWREELKKQEIAGKEILKIWEDLAVRERAAKGESDALSASHEVASKTMLTNMNKLKEAMQFLGSDQREINAAMDSYYNKWKQITASEDETKNIEKIKSELEKMGVTIGDTAERIQEKANKMIGVLYQGVLLGVITMEQAADQEVRIQQDAYRKMIKGGDEFYKALQSMFGSLETSLTNLFTGKGAKGSFAKLLDDLTAQVVGFLAKMLIIKPVMEALFGSEYTGKASSGSGMLTPFINSFQKMVSGWMTTGPANIPGSNSSSSFLSSIANLLPFGNFGSAASSSAAINNPSAYVATSNAAAGSGFFSQIGSFFSSLFGGGMATGGQIDPFKEYVVGEEGPELLRMGSRGGQIIPNKATQSIIGNNNDAKTPLSVVNHFYLSSPVDRRTQEQIAAMAANSISRSLARST